MQRWHPCLNPQPWRLVGQPYLELRELANNLFGLLKNGLQAFNNVSDMLLSVKADIVPAGSWIFNDIRQQIVNMKEWMEKAEGEVSRELRKLDVETERLTAEQRDIEEQKKQREGEIETFKITLLSHKNSLEQYTQALETERRNLKTAKDTLEDMRQKRDHAQTVRDVGIGLFAIPIVGWIAGAVMVGVGQTDMDRASDAVEEAAKEVHKCHCQVSLYTNNVSEYESLIHEARLDILRAETRILELKVKLDSVSLKRGMVADIQAKVRKADHQVGVLCGVGSCVELQTRHLILLEPVMKVMEEMISALGRITGEDLLNGEGLTGLMSHMKMNHEKFKQLAAANPNLPMIDF
ncbi:uncharacterized protein LOC114786195 [Denticeps clupeoides]|uniref:uncharacterized protein LOC114786195 n=1 Tax=Denticeps clupeoides TaxID=299321 RepID=UPI0010A37660|nr:uncharacterized protein LOC114786195 [Denticeps clupeoides]